VTLSCCDVRYNGRRRQSMSLEMVPEPRIDGQRSGPLAQRRVKSYEDAVGEPDYDRNRITQFIRQPFSTKPTVEELGRSKSTTAAATSINSRSRPTFSYNDTGSFEEVDEEKVGADSRVASFLYSSSQCILWTSTLHRPYTVHMYYTYMQTSYCLCVLRLR